MKTALVLSLLMTGLMSPSAFAGPKEFAALCKQPNLPEATRTTVDALVKFAGGGFNPRKPDCDLAAAKLAKITEIDLPGHTFHYYFVEDLSPFATLEHIEALSINQQNKVYDLSPLASLKQLRSLSISGTGVSEHSLEQLRHVEGIRDLTISVTAFTPLWEVLRLRRLESLGLHVAFREDSRRPRIDLSPLRSLSLQTLRIGSNMIGSADARFVSLGSLAYLRNLDVTGASIDAQELAMMPLETLQYVGMYETSRLANQDAIGRLVSLKKLTIAHAKLKSIEFMKTLKNLEHINLSSNEIEDATPLAELSGLISVDVSQNRINRSDSFARLYRLTSLDVTGNRLGFIDLRPHRNLVKVRAASNFMSLIALGSEYRDLKELDLSYNEFRSVEFLTAAAFPALENLDLDRNRIFRVDTLGSLVTLKRLDLDDNRITDISPLMTLKNIERLSARSNLLQSPVCPVSRDGACDFMHQGI